jgi:hypothetical protein
MEAPSGGHAVALSHSGRERVRAACVCGGARGGYELGSLTPKLPRSSGPTSTPSSVRPIDTYDDSTTCARTRDTQHYPLLLGRYPAPTVPAATCTGRVRRATRRRAREGATVLGVLERWRWRAGCTEARCCVGETPTVSVGKSSACESTVYSPFASRWCLPGSAQTATGRRFRPPQQAAEADSAGASRRACSTRR